MYSAEGLASQFDEAYEEFKDNLDHARSVAFRAERNPELPSPLDIMSEFRREEKQYENLGVIRYLQQGY